MDQNGDDFRHLQTLFPPLSVNKVKEGIFIEPHIRRIIRDPVFISKLNTIERNAWLSFVAVTEDFLGNIRSSNYEELVSNLLLDYKTLGCRMSLKIHFLHSHLDFFPPNQGAVIDEHGERFYQDVMALRIGEWTKNMLADYCWATISDNEQNLYKR